jgi:hypothetical protein
MPGVESGEHGSRPLGDGRLLYELLGKAWVGVKEHGQQGRGLFTE